MQPSTWNSTNQHWVPQFLLKGFGIKGNASEIWELEKEAGILRRRKVKDVASKQKLLPDSDDELLKSIETQAVQAVDQIRKKYFHSLTIPDRLSIDRLVSAMLQNDPYNGFDEEKARQDAIDSVSRSVREAIEYNGGFVEPETLDAFIDQRLNHDYLTLTLAGNSSVVQTMLGFMGLRAIYCSRGDFFIIGDSPILAVRNKTDVAGPSLLNRGSQVILPISSRCALLYDWETAPSIITDGGTIYSPQVLSLNQDYYHKSNCRLLYGRTKECLTDSQQPQITLENAQRSTAVSHGWRVMQQHLATVRARDAEKEKRDAEGLRLEARELVLKAARQYEPSSGDHKA